MELQHFACKLCYPCNYFIDIFQSELSFMFAGCDTSTQCYLDDTLLVDITCTESSYGQTNITDCYDQYFSLSYCKCTDPHGVISATNVTYWCNPGGQWEPELSSLACYGKDFHYLML